MTETQRRIRAYKKALPELRERVIAVALLLAMSASMLGTASFAWLTISKNPEVTAVNTTVAANGNLEIALATGTTYTPVEPGESKVGDSSAAEGQSVTAANITWGNLVNLADPSYGLEKMVLRPAQLNESALLTSPLYGATYGDDGRTKNLSSDFAYSTWEPANEEEGREEGFLIGNKLGVRAITSVVYQENAGTAFQAKKIRDVAEQMNTNAGQAYKNITMDKDLMGSLATVMGIYLTAMLNESNETVKYQDVYNLSEIFRLFIEAYALQAQAMVNLANFQLFVWNSTGEETTSYQEYTVETLLAASESTLKPGVYLPGLNQMKKDYTMLQNNYSSEAVENDMMELVAQAEAAGEIPYDSMEKIVDSLVIVGDCLVGNKTVNALAADKSDAINLVMGGGTHEVKITNGVLYNFEKLNGTHAKIENMRVKARYLIEVTLQANITTNAPIPHQFQLGLERGDSNNKGGALTGYSQDTYGLAIDLWARTNGEGSHLILEGNILTETEDVYPTQSVNEEFFVAKVNGENVDVYSQTSEGGTQTWYKLYTTQAVVPDETPVSTMKTTEYDLYVLTITYEDENGEAISSSMDVYEKKKNDGTNAWFNAASHTEVSEETLDGKTPTRKVEQVETVIGFEGENRIWDKDQNSLISTDATTQGSGSCYVYYADTPEDQARSLDLLKSFKVAFIDAQGNLLAKASMDTERHYATTGRVIVPLVLDKETADDLGMDAFGNTTYGITSLQKNVPTRITALVYLDGSDLYNSNVLAAADIHGRLNIQFGTSAAMEPMPNTKLEEEVLTLSASLSDTTFDFDDASSDLTTTVTVKVDGTSPSTVKAFFLREINATQGSRETEMNFTKNASGEWVADYTFMSPGNYVLRSVQLDGVEYDLPLSADGQPLRVTVSGFALEYLTCREGAVSVMSAGRSHTVNLDLKFATDDVSRMPRTVQGRYLRQDGTAVNVNFTMGSDNVWTGSATFVASGNYTMQYLLLDGKYTELPANFWQTADLTLGMRVAVRTTSPRQFLFDPENMPESLNMEVEILDSEGEQLGSMAGAYLYYAKAGSTEIEKGMSTPLTWDPQEECYTGSFSPKIGRFSFSSVTVGKNSLTNDGGASPVFQIMSPVPPTFDRDETETSQFVLNTNNARMLVYINESDGVSVKALLTKEGVKDSTGNLRTYEVYGSEAGENAWSFPVPLLTNTNDVAGAGQDGTQDGKWSIQEIHVYDAYSAEGVEYTEDAPLVFANTEYSFVTSKVISDAYITLTTPAGWDANLGADESTGSDGKAVYTASGTFLTEYSVSGLQVKITDFEDEPINGLSLNMSYDYDGKTEANGGYSSTSVGATAGYRTVNWASADGMTFIQKDAITVNQAGKYTAVLSYIVNGKTYSADADEFDFSVWSKTPTATISAITPTGSNPAKITYTTSSPAWYLGGGTVPNFKTANETSALNTNTNTATVYALATADNSTQHHASFTKPSVTVTIGGVGSGCTVNFTLPAGSTNNSEIVFSRTGNGTITQTLGTVKQIQTWKSNFNALTHTLSAYYGHGNQTITTMTIKDSITTYTYTVTLTNSLTINNPSSVNQS